MAEGFNREVKAKAASDALTSQFANLVQIIDPLMVAIRLFSKKIVDNSLPERVRLASTTQTEKAFDVLTAVSNAVKVNPDVFDTFCDVLDSEPVTKDIVKLLKEEYQKSLHCAKQADAEQVQSCTCTVLQKSFLSKLRERLRVFKDFNYSDQKNALQTAISEYVTDFVRAGCTSTDHLNEHLSLLHEKENLITDPTMVLWAKQLAGEMFSETAAALQLSPTTLVPAAAKPPLFSKPIVYHAGICSLAVNKTSAGEYQQFFKDKKFVPGHSLREVSISRSKQDRYLIATQDDSVYYIAFQSEPNITEWPKKYSSFDKGITIQTEKFPIDFVTELLNNDKNRVVLAGFSFGGMLACSVAVQVWQRGYIPAQLLQENLVCITFAQPHLPVPQLADIARDRPEIATTLHAIYYEHDVVPRLVKVLDLPCSTLGIEKKEPGIQMKVKELPKLAFQDTLTLDLFSEVGVLLQTPESLETPRGKLEAVLKRLLDGLSGTSSTSQAVTYYQLFYSTGSPSCLQFSEMTKEQIALQSSHLKTQELQQLTPELSEKHSMKTYCQKMFHGYLDKPPEYRIPPSGRAPVPLENMRPVVSGIILHEHGSELALVVEGSNLWFCNRLSICRDSTDTPASRISGTSIKLNFDKESKRTLSSLSDGQEVAVKVSSHFSKSPVQANVKVQKKEFPVSTRQRQLARLTPSQLIELTYLSALLEQHPYTGLQPSSHKMTVIKEFLEKVVEVVPLESVGYAIAYGNQYVAQQCATVIDATFEDLPVSALMSDGFSLASGRLTSGMSSEIWSVLVSQLVIEDFPFSTVSDIYAYWISLDDKEEYAIDHCVAQG